MEVEQVDSAEAATDEALANDPVTGQAVSEEALVEELVVDDPIVKKVHINEENDVFEIDPDSTNVILIEKPPKPAAITVGPTLEMIIGESTNLVHWLLEHIDLRRHALSKQVFILYHVQDSVDLYYNHVMKLNGFFVHNDLLQSEWYYKYCRQLPGYGDYTRLLRDSPDRVQVDGVEEPISERDLRRLVSDVTDNFYAGGAHVRTQRMVCRRIERERNDRLQLCKDMTKQFPKWFSLFNVECQSEQSLADRLLELLAYIDLLSTGETTAPLPHDNTGPVVIGDNQTI